MGAVLNVNKTVYFIPQQRLENKPLFFLRILKAFLFVNALRQEGEIVVGGSYIKPSAEWHFVFSGMECRLNYMPGGRGEDFYWFFDSISIPSEDGEVLSLLVCGRR
jgi:hypothetical protein